MEKYCPFDGEKKIGTFIDDFRIKERSMACYTQES